MGLFDSLKKEKAAGQAVNSNKINLEKHKVSLDKSIVNLAKTHGVDLSKHRARVVVVLDYSGSMSSGYKERKVGAHDSEVQQTLTKLFPVALKFDDDGELDVWLFQTDFKKMETMTQDNYDTYVESIIRTSGYRMGGTNYAPVLEDVINTCLKDGKSKDPVFVLFETDGDNSASDKSKMTALIKESAKMNIFVQFIGVGTSSFDYLEKLDDLGGRACDNTGFEKFSSLAEADDTEVYNKLLEQYIEWLKVKPV